MDNSQLWLLPLATLAPYLVLVGIVPVVAGYVVLQASRLAKVPNLNYLRCWKASLVACCYAVVILFPVTFLLRRFDLTDPALRAVQFSLVCATHLIVVPLFLKTFYLRALLAQGLGLVLTDLLTLIVITHV